MNGKIFILIVLMHIVAQKILHKNNLCLQRIMRQLRETVMNELILWAGAAILIIGLPVLLARKPQP